MFIDPGFVTSDLINLPLPTASARSGIVLGGLQSTLKTAENAAQERRSAGEFGAWHDLSDSQQLLLSRAALRRAAATIANQAAMLANEIEAGLLRDYGGSEALRLFAAVVRANSDEALAEVKPT